MCLWIQKANIHSFALILSLFEQDKQNAVTDAKREIASMAVDAAEKIIGKKLTDSDDEELISDIIDRM